MTSLRGILGQSWNSEISAILPCEIWFFSEFQLWPNIPLKLVIFPFWKNYKILKKSSVTWSWRDKGVASSLEWQAYFCQCHFTPYRPKGTKHFDGECTMLKLFPVNLAKVKLFLTRRSHIASKSCIKQNISAWWFCRNVLLCVDELWVLLQGFSMTSLLSHTLAYSIRHSFRHKISNYTIKKFLRLEF